MRDLSVVIPAFNEEARLGATLEAIRGYLRRGWDPEIIVVDDGSRDGTRRVAEEHGARVIGYAENRGKGHAVRLGMLEAGKSRVLMSDADHSTPIGEVEKLWPFLDRGCDIAIGSRSLPGSQVDVRQNICRETMGRTFNLIIGLLGVRGFRDTQCGFKLFTRRAVHAVFPRLRTEGFAFDVEVLTRALSLGLRVKEVPIRWTNSPLSRVRPIRDSARMLGEVLRMRGLR